MKRTLNVIFLAVILFGFSNLIYASTIVVTTIELQGWHSANQRSGGAWDINLLNPRSGNGSLMLSLPDPTGLSPSPKIDLEYLNAGGMGLLNSINSLGFDWYRDASSGAASHYTPALRIYIHDPTIGPSHYAYLIWEGIYNNYPAASGPVPTDTWIAEDILNQNYWKYPFGSESNYYGRGLWDWGFSAETVVWGMNVGLGSGWDGSYLSYVDNVTIGFNGSEATIYNFEGVSAPIPEPGTILLLGSGFLGLGFIGRFRKRKA